MGALGVQGGTAGRGAGETRGWEWGPGVSGAGARLSSVWVEGMQDSSGRTP